VTMVHLYGYKKRQRHVTPVQTAYYIFVRQHNDLGISLAVHQQEP
jgi:hypothetical protein